MKRKKILIKQKGKKDIRSINPKIVALQGGEKLQRKIEGEKKKSKLKNKKQNNLNNSIHAIDSENNKEKGQVKIGQNSDKGESKTKLNCIKEVKFNKKIKKLL